MTSNANTLKHLHYKSTRVETSCLQCIETKQALDVPRVRTESGDALQGGR